MTVAVGRPGVLGQAFVDASPLAVIGFDPSSRLWVINPAFCDMIGTNLEQLQADPSPLTARIPASPRERFIANRFGPGEPDGPHPSGRRRRVVAGSSWSCRWRQRSPSGDS